MEPILIGQTDSGNSEQSKNPRAVVAHPLSERSADCASEQPERQRDRAKKNAWAAANYRSPNPRSNIVTKPRGWGERRGARAPDPETGREPQYNEPDYGLWTEEDEDIMDAGLLTAWEASVRKPLRALVGAL